MALGIIAFALTGVLGLLSVGFSSGKESTEDTLVAAMANSVVTDLRSRYFVDNTPMNAPSDMTPRHRFGEANVLPGTDDVALGGTPERVTKTLYFDREGAPVLAATNALYKCTLTLQGDVDTLGAIGSDGSAAKQCVNLMRVTLFFQWPADAPHPIGSRTLHARIARY